MFNPVAPYGYLLPTVYLFMADIANPDLFVCGCRTWICLDITRFYEEQNKVFAWTQQNNLTLNPDKTTFTQFTPDPAEYNSEKLNHPSSNHTYTKLTPKHIQMDGPQTGRSVSPTPLARGWVDNNNNRLLSFVVS